MWILLCTNHLFTFGGVSSVSERTTLIRVRLQVLLALHREKNGRRVTDCTFILNEFSWVTEITKRVQITWYHLFTVGKNAGDGVHHIGKTASMMLLFRAPEHIGPIK